MAQSEPLNTTRLLRLLPLMLDSVVREGFSDFYETNLDLHVKIYVAALKQDPNESGVCEALGMSYMMDNKLSDDERLEEAKNAFDKAIEITPDSVAPRLQRARVLAMLGEQPGAIADLDKAIEISPQKAVPLVLRARIQQQSGNL